MCLIKYIRDDISNKAAVPYFLFDGLSTIVNSVFKCDYVSSLTFVFTSISHRSFANTTH